jgi:hypothetical protein
VVDALCLSALLFVGIVVPCACLSWSRFIAVAVHESCACLCALLRVRDSLFDLESGEGLALAVESLFKHMNTSPGAAKFGVAFAETRKPARASGLSDLMSP